MQELCVALSLHIDKTVVEYSLNETSVLVSVGHSTTDRNIQSHTRTHASSGSSATYVAFIGFHLFELQ